MAKANRKFELSAIIRMVDRITTPARRIYHAVQRNIIRPMMRATKAVAAFGAAALKLGTIMAGTTAGALFLVGRQVKEFADSADKLAKSSRQVGLTVEQLSRLAYAADLSGVSLDELIAGLRPFSRNLELARLKQGEMYSVLRKAAPEFLRQLQRTKSVEEAFLLMAGAVEAAEDSTRKNTLAMAAFGEAGVKFASLFSKGADGVRQMTEEADRLGFTLSTESAEAAEQFNDDLNRLKRTLGLVSRIMSEALIPALTPLIQQATEWAQANKEIIGQKLADWTMAVIDALRSIDWGEIVRMVESLARKFSRFLDDMGGASGVIRGVATAFGWLATAFEAVGYVLGTAAAVIVESIVSQWQQIADWWDRTTRTLSAAWEMFTEGLALTWEGTISGLMAFGRAFGAMWDSVTAGMRSAWESVTDFFVDAWRSVVEFVQPLIDGITAAIDATVNGLRAIGVLDAPLSLGGAVPTSQAGAFRALGFDPARFGVAAAQKQESAIQLDVKFDNAPPGLRVNQRTEGAPVAGSVQVQTNNTGNRTLATGAPL